MAPFIRRFSSSLLYVSMGLSSRSLLAVLDHRTPAPTREHGREGTPIMNREDDDGNTVFASKTDRRSIHHLEIAGENLVVAQCLIALRRGDLLGIGTVNAVDLRAFQHGLAVHLHRAKRGGGIRGEEGIARAGGEDHHPIL